jgi:hypothetical protein
LGERLLRELQTLSASTSRHFKADENPEFTTKWKTDSGFVLIDAATIIAISDAVLAHVDSCFEAEDEVLSAIDAGTITTRGQIDDAFAE